MDLDPVLLARLQFAFTITFHIIFPSFTIGLSAYIATLGVLWLKRGAERYHRIMQFWTKIFAVSFAMGVVSGIVLSYQFGTNWSRFSVIVGNVIGPAIGYEVLTAFFLEATFLGMLLFGWNRVPPWLSALSAAIVAVGARYLVAERHEADGRTMVRMAVGMIAVLAPLQLFFGDQHGLNTLKYQPIKVAAMEAHWDGSKPGDFHILAWPDEKNEMN